MRFCLKKTKKQKTTDLDYNTMTSFMTIWFNLNVLLGSPDGEELQNEQKECLDQTNFLVIVMRN